MKKLIEILIGMIAIAILMAEVVIVIIGGI